MTDKSYVIYQGSDDWSALYEDGKLVTVGDHYLIDEKLHDLLGIPVVQSDAFMQGGNQYKDVAQTLEAVRAFERQETAAHEAAEKLREDARRLRAQADALENK